MTLNKTDRERVIKLVELRLDKGPHLRLGGEGRKRTHGAEGVKEHLLHCPGMWPARRTQPRAAIIC